MELQVNQGRGDSLDHKELEDQMASKESEGHLEQLAQLAHWDH